MPGRTNDRKKHDAGIAHYLPVHLGEIPDYYRRFIEPIDIVILKTCPMTFICLASTYEKRGQRRSRIVSSLTAGSVVTTPRTDLIYVVTEFGIVNLKGKSVAERAKALISIAHPDFRDALERDAYDKRMIPRGFF